MRGTMACGPFMRISGQQDWLDDVLRGIGDGVAHLVDGAGDKFMNAIALRVAPARSSTTSTKKPKAAEAPEPEPDTRTALQKLADRFK